MSEKQNRLLWWGVGLSLVTACLLTALVWSDLCDIKCSKVRDYRLLGLSFEVIGCVYFSVAVGLWCASWKRLLLPFLALGVGAELAFFYTQKLLVQSFCPICLGIGASVSLAALGTYLIERRGQLFVGCMLLSALVTPFAIEHREDALQLELGLKERIAFGDAHSDIEIYLFTDWGCSACRKLEPRLESLWGQLVGGARIYFIDLPIHQITYNYMPINLSFMQHNKRDYLALREILTTLSKEDPTPFPDTIEKAVEPLNVEYVQLPYTEVLQGLKLFQSLAVSMKVSKTPTMLIKHAKKRKVIRLVGPTGITIENIRDAMNTIDNL